MGYQFSMEKKTAIVVVSGFVLVGALLFSAGLLMGVHFGLVSALVSENTQPNQKPAEPTAPTTIAEQTVNRAAVMHESATHDANNIAPDHSRDRDNSVIARDEPHDGVAEPEQDETQMKDPLFWVQVGVFRSEVEADRLFGNLEDHGYEPAIYEGIDSDQRLYYAVRIGSFYDRDIASQTAAEFERREKKRAIVRTVNAL